MVVSCGWPVLGDTKIIGRESPPTLEFSTNSLLAAAEGSLGLQMPASSNLNS